MYMYIYIYIYISLKLAINYLIDNCYFTVGNSTFRQVTGIPMASDRAPFMGNHFLYYFDDNDLYEKHFHEIYPEELGLKREHVSSTKASILDIDLGIKEKIIST